jgi:hypothetical protein
MKRLFAAIVFASLSAGVLPAQAANPKAAPAAPRSYAIVGATIHTVSGADIPKGTLVVRDGKIVSVSAGAAPADVPAIDASGRHLYPSLFPPMTVLGLQEIDAVRATVDTSEIGDINPDARGSVAVNFDSELLPVARSGGVLVAGVTPIGGIISGSVAAMKMRRCATPRPSRSSGRPSSSTVRRRPGAPSSRRRRSGTRPSRS